MLAESRYMNNRNNAPVDLSRFTTINADRERQGLSSKYAFVPTMQVVKVMEASGWRPVIAQEQRCNNEGRIGFQRHLIRFRQEGAPLIVEKDMIFPEIVLSNSHDGLASFRIMAGLFRVVCCNGLTVADSTFQTMSIRHMGYADAKVKDAIENLCDTIPMITDRVKEFQAIELTKDEQGVFAHAALIAKYGDIDKPDEDGNKRAFDVPRLLAPVRTQDVTSTLWNTYNTVQEKLVKGARIERNVNSYRMKKARGINSIQENTRVNQALWALTEKMAELKA